MFFKKQYAPIAQLDRASVYGTEGQGFESLWAHRLKVRTGSPVRTFCVNGPQGFHVVPRRQIAGLLATVKPLGPRKPRIAGRWPPTIGEMLRILARGPG